MSDNAERAAQLADEVRNLIAEVDNRLMTLRSLGYTNARVTRDDASNRLQFAASYTKEFKL